jgi:hypothetical protein
MALPFDRLSHLQMSPLGARCTVQDGAWRFQGIDMPARLQLPPCHADGLPEGITGPKAPFRRVVRPGNDCGPLGKTIEVD